MANRYNIKKYTFLLFALCLIISGKSQSVDIETAKKVAINFYYEKANSFFEIKKHEISINESFTKVSPENLPLYYIFNLNPDGFIIVSAQQNVFPVLGYSFKGSYSNETENPNFNYYMNIFSSEISDASVNNTLIDPKSLSAWNKYSVRNFVLNNKAYEKAVAPLLLTTWNQDKYYNELCPADAAGPGGHTYAGCVATALGQLMFYHRWPQTGTGSYTYNHPTYGNISADFSSTTYDWNAMANSVTINNLAVAKLLYHLGVSVDMDYGPNGSGMWNHKGAYTLRTYFKYVPQTRYIFRDSTTLNWDSLVITNLDAKKPLYYAGWEDTTYTSGHAFVCDGYQTNDYYHFNWGWGGALDGFFYNNQLNPGGANFNILQELVVDIYPDTNNYTYPEYCSGINNALGSNGTISDGSSLNNYQENSDCNWLINPDCGIKVNLVFDRFDLADGDTIKVYDGQNAQAPLINQFDATNPPVTSNNTYPTSIESTGKFLFLNFSSDNNLQSEGFNASYSTRFCATDTVHDLNGTISDGSGTCSYNNSSNCRWFIKPSNAQSITLNFTEFDLATNNVGDYIQIYKNSISVANSLGVYNYTNPPTGPITVNAPVAAIRFVTNSSVQAGGWSFDYSTTLTDVPSNNILNSNNGIIIFPNPSTGKFAIRHSGQLNPDKIEVVNLLGETVYTIPALNNGNEIDLSSLSKGVYLLKICNRENVLMDKIIIQ